MSLQKVITSKKGTKKKLRKTKKYDCHTQNNTIPPQKCHQQKNFAKIQKKKNTKKQQKNKKT